MVVIPIIAARTQANVSDVYHMCTMFLVLPRAGALRTGVYRRDTVIEIGVRHASRNAAAT